MRLLALLLIIACCIASVAADAPAAAPATPKPAPTPAAAAAAPATPAAAPAAAAAAAPAAPAAAPTPAAAAASPSVDLSGITAKVEELGRTHSASVSELKAAQQATASKVSALAQTVETGLAKLHAADDAQTAAAEAQSKGSAGKATAEEFSATKTRLEAVERELAELKQMLSSFVSSTPKASAAAADKTLQEIKASQQLILAQLANATTMWSFDHEALLAQAKNSTYAASSKLSKFLAAQYASFMANYPSYVEQAKIAGLHAWDHAQVLGGHAQVLSSDAHFQLTGLLGRAGVPPEFVQHAALTVLGVVALLALVIVWNLIKCVCRACGCCRGNKQQRANKKKGSSPRPNEAQ